MSYKKSPIDDLFNSLYGYYPSKAGASLEMLSDIAYAITNDISVKHDQKIKSGYCDTEYQIDGLAEKKDGTKEMLEAKDYTIRNEHVGRGDLQKLQGALTDLDVTAGKFVSATDYTKDAKEYAEGTVKNPHQVPIDLLHVRPSTSDDEQGRIKQIVCKINARGLDFTSDCIKPIYNDQTLAFLKQHNLLNQPLGVRMSYVLDSEGNSTLSIENYSRDLNKLVDMNDHEQKSISGMTPMENAFMKLEDGSLCPIGGLAYDIAIYDLNYSFAINQKGKPVLLIKSQDGKINKLITDEELKRYNFDAKGNMVKK